MANNSESYSVDQTMRKLLEVASFLLILGVCVKIVDNEENIIITKLLFTVKEKKGLTRVVTRVVGIKLDEGLMIKMLLMMAGIETNPGPIQYDVKDETVEGWELDEVKVKEQIYRTSRGTCVVCGVGNVMPVIRKDKKDDMLIYTRDGLRKAKHAEYRCNFKNKHNDCRANFF